jgi:hypothetical protein
VAISYVIKHRYLRFLRTTISVLIVLISVIGPLSALHKLEALSAEHQIQDCNTCHLAHIATPTETNDLIERYPPPISPFTPATQQGFYTPTVQQARAPPLNS